MFFSPKKMASWQLDAFLTIDQTKYFDWALFDNVVAADCSSLRTHGVFMTLMHPGADRLSAKQWARRIRQVLRRPWEVVTFFAISGAVRATSRHFQAWLEANPIVYEHTLSLPPSQWLARYGHRTFTYQGASFSVDLYSPMYRMLNAKTDMSPASVEDMRQGFYFSLRPYFMLSTATGDPDDPFDVRVIPAGQDLPSANRDLTETTTGLRTHTGQPTGNTADPSWAGYYDYYLSVEDAEFLSKSEDAGRLLALIGRGVTVPFDFRRLPSVNHHKSSRMVVDTICYISHIAHSSHTSYFDLLTRDERAVPVTNELQHWDIDWDTLYRRNPSQRPCGSCFAGISGDQRSSGAHHQLTLVWDTVGQQMKDLLHSVNQAYYAHSTADAKAWLTLWKAASTNWNTAARLLYAPDNRKWELSEGIVSAVEAHTQLGELIQTATGAWAAPTADVTEWNTVYDRIKIQALTDAGMTDGVFDPGVHTADAEERPFHLTKQARLQELLGRQIDDDFPVWGGVIVGVLVATIVSLLVWGLWLNKGK